MELEYGPEYDDFRAEVKSFVKENEGVNLIGKSLRSSDRVDWQQKLIDHGYFARSIPKEYGGFGGDMDILKTRIIAEEFAKSPIPKPLGGQGIQMLVPTLLELGTEDQKQAYVKPTLRGEIIWCQGYSEPNSGSDLASLQTKGELDGDEWVINGQKIWTSNANYADMIFCLVRTGPQEPKHDGISFLLIDMDQPGVEVKPIKLISGKSPFCETFFTDASAPKSNLIGEINKGWTIAKRLLQHERSMISGMGLATGAGSGPRKTSGMAELGKRYVGTDEKNRLDDAQLRTKIAKHDLNSRAFTLTLQRMAEDAKTGGPSATASMGKYYGSEQNKLRYEIMLQAMGTSGLGWEGEPFAPEELAITREWLRSKANSIEGGTSEINLNVISKRVLDLPD